MDAVAELGHLRKLAEQEFPRERVSEEGIRINV